MDATGSNPRIAYAASFGTENCEFSANQILDCRKLLQKFSFVSVREQSGTEICKRIFGVQASHVLDPTLLLSKTEYQYLIKDVHPSKGDLMVYILDEIISTEYRIKQFAHAEGLTPFRINIKVENLQVK